MTTKLKIPTAIRSLPPPFADAPTDAEYAMELISQRVARGESFHPPPLARAGKKKKNGPQISRTSTGLSSQGGSDVPQPGRKDAASRSWKDLGRLAGRGLDIMDEGKKLVKGETVRFRVYHSFLRVCTDMVTTA